MTRTAAREIAVHLIFSLGFGDGDAQSLLDSPPALGGGSTGKLILSDLWYFVTNLPADAAQRLSPGGTALLRFSGLQTVDMLDSLYDKETGGLYDGPLCPDWLVLIADAFVEKLGGFEAVQRKMSPFPAHAYEGGALLQTGELPCPGGPGQAKGLEGYYHMGKVIDPIRWKHATVHLYSRRLGLQLDKKLGRTWAERFAPKQCRVLTFSPRKTGATS